MSKIAWDFIVENRLEEGRFDLDQEGLRAPLDAPPGSIFVLVTDTVDLFDDRVEDDTITDALAIVLARPDCQFMITTKKLSGAAAVLDNPRKYMPTIAQRLEDFTGGAIVLERAQAEDPIANLWLGVEVAEQAQANERIPLLLAIPAGHHFATFAPMAGYIDWGNLDPMTKSDDALGFRLDALKGKVVLNGKAMRPAAGALDWILASGIGQGFSNTVNPDWIRDTYRQCHAAGVDFTFAAWGNLEPDRDYSAARTTKEAFAGRIVDVPGSDPLGVGAGTLIAFPRNPNDPAFAMKSADPEDTKPGRLDGIIHPFPKELS